MSNRDDTLKAAHKYLKGGCATKGVSQARTWASHCEGKWYTEYVNASDVYSRSCFYNLHRYVSGERGSTKFIIAIPWHNGTTGDSWKVFRDVVTPKFIEEKTPYGCMLPFTTFTEYGVIIEGKKSEIPYLYFKGFSIFLRLPKEMRKGCRFLSWVRDGDLDFYEALWLPFFCEPSDTGSHVKVNPSGGLIVRDQYPVNIDHVTPKEWREWTPAKIYSRSTSIMGQWGFDVTRTGMSRRTDLKDLFKLNDIDYTRNLTKAEFLDAVRTLNGEKK